MTKPDPTEREEELDVGDATDADAGNASADAEAPTDGTSDDGADDTEEPTPEQRVAELEDKWLRARAEMDNMRRRAQRDVDEARRFGATPLLKSLLEVLDTLQRALEAPTEGVDDSFVEGLRLIEQQFASALEAYGVTPIAAETGTGFDPSVHRALLEQPTADQEPGTIVAELVRGYRLHDRLLREAQVTVARAPEDDDKTDDGDDHDDSTQQKTHADV